MADILELAMSRCIKEIVSREVIKIEDTQTKRELTDKEVVKLEKLAKVYSIMMADTRELLKSGVLKGLSDDQLNDFVDGD